jgi:hypothetical protein
MSIYTIIIHHMVRHQQYFQSKNINNTHILIMTFGVLNLSLHIIITIQLFSFQTIKHKLITTTPLCIRSFFTILFIYLKIFITQGFFLYFSSFGLTILSLLSLFFKLNHIIYMESKNINTFKFIF